MWIPAGVFVVVKLSEVLVERSIVMPIDQVDKWRAIEVLTDRLVETEQVDPAHRDHVHTALVTREESMSTGMENGIAIPHTSVEHVAETAVALGVSPEGIEFESIDGRPAHLVVLLVNPAHRTKAHIRTLAEIARLLSSADLRSRLVAAPSASEVLETIRAAEVAAA